MVRILDGIKRYALGNRYRRGGNGYLRRTIAGWNRAATRTPFIVLTDLDSGECAPQLLSGWLPFPKHPNLLFRVAVREVESWLLADPVNLARFLGVPKSLMPAMPDMIDNPKGALVNIARKSRSRDIRERIAPRVGSTAQQGPDYNGCLGYFVRSRWDFGAAQANSPSLARTVRRLSSFVPRWT